MRVAVEIQGLERARRIVRQVRNLGADPQPLLHIAGSLLEASTVRRFDEEKGPGGIPWPKSRRAAGLVKGKPPGKTLTDTGDLRDSIRHEVRPGEVEVGADGLKNAVKAPANQFGVHSSGVVVRHSRTINEAFGVPLPAARTYTVRGHARTMNIPARPFVGVDDEDRIDLEDAWRDHLIGLFNE